MGRHEGPEALISERTPRQTEGRGKRKKRKSRKSEGQAEEEKKGARRGEKDVSEGKSRLRGIPRSFRKTGQTARSKLLMHIKVNVRLCFLGSRYIIASGMSG